MANAKSSIQQGYGRSDRHRFTIPNGATGVNVFRLDLGRPYAFHVIRIEDCTGFQANTTISAKVANDDTPAQLMCTLCEANEPSITWSKTMPTSGAIEFMLTHAFGARYISFLLSQNSDGIINIDVYGYDPTFLNSSGGV